jgi:hypothetical protein
MNNASSPSIQPDNTSVEATYSSEDASPRQSGLGSIAQPESIAELNSHAANTVYTPLKDSEIRLVLLHAAGADEPLKCTVFNVVHAAAHPYEPLSYVWGTQADPAGIILNGVDWKVTRNLYGALLQLRSPHADRILWIDALAINQCCIPERNAQVLKIRDIYASGSTTIIWLTFKECSSIKFLFQLFALVQQGLELSTWVAKRVRNERGGVLSLLFKVSRLGYWSRIWIVQEIMYSNSALLVYGDSQVPYLPFLAFWRSAMEALKQHMSSQEMYEPNISIVFTTLSEGFFGPEALPRLGSGLEKKYLTLERWYQLQGVLKSTDRRDIIFGLYGCFSPEIRRIIRVDYSIPVRQLFIEFTQIIIMQTRSLDILPRKPAEDTLPSWVPHYQGGAKKYDWDSTHTACSSIPFFVRFADDGYVLQAKGICFALVQESTESYHHDPVGETSYAGFFNRSFNCARPEHLQAAWSTCISAIVSLGVPIDNEALLVSFISAYAKEELSIDIFQSVRDAVIKQEISATDWEKVFVDTGLFRHHEQRLFSFTEWSHRNEPEKVAGYGLGHFRLKKGDKLCVLFGCSEPVILRQVHDYHILIGSAFVPGYMKGKAVRGIEVGTEEPVDFFIH